MAIAELVGCAAIDDPADAFEPPFDFDSVV
jgi:hypothetical protein